MAGVWDTIVNAATGTVSQEQKDALVAQARADLIRAGMSPAEAQAQAYSDITASLISDNADPSQQSVANALTGPLNEALTGNPLTSPGPGTSVFLTAALLVGLAAVLMKATD